MTRWPSAAASAIAGPVSETEATLSSDGACAPTPRTATGPASNAAVRTKGMNLILAGQSTPTPRPLPATGARDGAQQTRTAVMLEACIILTTVRP